MSHRETKVWLRETSSKGAGTASRTRKGAAGSNTAARTNGHLGPKGAGGGGGGGGGGRPPWRETVLAAIDARELRRRGVKATQRRAILADASKRLGATSTLTGNPPPDCELVAVEYRECPDEQGQTHTCRCELYECTTGSFWQCTPID